MTHKRFVLIINAKLNKHVLKKITIWIMKYVDEKTYFWDSNYAYRINNDAMILSSY